jgi:hypothetical protein
MSTPIGSGQYGTDDSKGETEDSARKLFQLGRGEGF